MKNRVIVLFVLPICLAMIFAALLVAATEIADITLSEKIRAECGSRK
jgi:hypothetical protein